MDNVIEGVYAKGIVAACWIVGVCGIGVALGSASPSSWVTLAILALVPPGVSLWLWATPPQTMSQRIDSGRQ
jgi:hypothetical protein